MLILWFCHPGVLLSIFAFHCPQMWSHDENVDCKLLYHVIIWSYTFIFWSIKIISHFWGFCPLWFWSFGSFVLWCFCPFLLFSVHPRDCMTRMLIVHTCIRWSWDCTPWLLEHFYGFCPLWYPLLLACFCPPTSSHYENVGCPHLYQVIMGSYTLIFGVLKYFLIFGGFVRFDADPLDLSSWGAFVHFCFSLSDHVITWWECWLSPPVSCDHGIVHLDFWSIMLFSHFWGFCPLWFWSFGSFVLWCFCPFLLFYVRPRDHMTRMLIVHICIMWSWDRTPWFLEY